MSYTALIIVLVAALVFLAWSILKISTLPKQPRKRVAAAAAAPSISIQVRRESDGIHLVIPDVVPMDDGPDSIFPDIINDVEPDSHGLSLEFWQKVASMPEISDPEERERLAQTLADAGIISKANISLFALLNDEAAAQDSTSENEDESDAGPTPTRQDDGADPQQQQVVYPETEPAPRPPLDSPEYGAPDYRAEKPEVGSQDDDFANHEFNI